MKRLIAFVLVLITVIPAAAAAPSVSAQAAVLITTDGNQKIYGKNEHKKLGMASTTKIMTSLLAIEFGCPDMEIVTTKEMVTVEGTSMGLKIGDTVTLNALIYGMLLQSGNDAANTVAHVVGGGVENFTVMMNSKAKKLGMEDTNFVNPTGLWHKEHYSTAYDMAILGAYGVSKPIFSEICASKRACLEYGNPPYKRTLYNHNRLLSSYEGAIGIKTGFTKNTGRCLVSAAEKNGITLICVTLNAPSDWKDHKALLDWGFSVCKKIPIEDNLEYFIPVTGGIVPKVSVAPYENPSYTSVTGKKQDIKAQVYLEKFLYAPVEVGRVVGKVDYYLGETLIKSVDLVAQFGVESGFEELKEDEGFFDKVKDFIRERFDLISKK
ncbi:MAG: D-alanyl-D-alanine carboxypeptidase family protein [Acutalibacteraceae bacterium]